MSFCHFTLIVAGLVFSVASPALGKTETDKINQFFKDTFEENLSHSPQFQTWIGQKGDDYDKLDNDSDASEKEEYNRTKRQLKALRQFKFDQLDDQAKISYRIFELQSEREILYYDKFRHHGYGISHNWGPHTSLPSFMINNHRVDNASDAKAYISRLGHFGKKFDWTIEDLEQGLKIGVIPPRFVYDQVVEGSRNIIKGKPFDSSAEDSPLWADFKKKVTELKLKPAAEKKLLDQAKSTLTGTVKPAYERLIAYIKKLKPKSSINGGSTTLPNGKAYYQAMLRHHTSTDYTADFIHDLGVKEVARIHGEMKQIMKQVEFKGDLQAFFKFMKESPKFKYPSTKQGREQYLTDTNKIIDGMRSRLKEMFTIFPKAPVEVKAVEKYREKSAGIAFYNAPTKDGSRPGRYYVNLYDMDAVSKYEMEALAYHEAIPGHHMQSAIAIELEGIPEFRKYNWFTAYGEGWGLYSEFLPKEYGFYQDPYSDFGRLSMELWRACRLVVDTGIHAKGWSFDKALKYLADNTPSADGDNTKAIERYTTWPGQATAYKIGMIKILDLRENAKKALGKKFDIRAFHDEVLRYGAVPLAVLEERIEAWVGRTKKKAAH